MSLTGVISRAKPWLGFRPTRSDERPILVMHHALFCPQAADKREVHDRTVIEESRRRLVAARSDGSQYILAVVNQV